MNIQESNKLIAEFMGVESYYANGYTNFIYGEDNHRTDVDLHYDKEWNWLMPVVERINTLDGKYKGSIYSDPWGIVKCNIWMKIKEKNHYELLSRPHFKNEDFKNPINSFYKTVVEFIKWYNKELMEEQE